MSNASIAIATTFARQFNIGAISIDDFDCFIIDNGMVTDPETDDPKSQKYKGFVNQRAAAKRTLNAAGSALRGGNAFMIQVRRAGVEYEIVPFASASVDVAEGLGDKVRLFADNKLRALEPTRKKVKALLREDPTNADLLEANRTLAMIDAEATALAARVHAGVNHFNNGVEMAKRYADERLQLARKPA